MRHTDSCYLRLCLGEERKMNVEKEKWRSRYGTWKPYIERASEPSSCAVQDLMEKLFTRNSARRRRVNYFNFPRAQTRHSLSAWRRFQLWPLCKTLFLSRVKCAARVLKFVRHSRTCGFVVYFHQRCYIDYVVPFRARNFLLISLCIHVYSLCVIYI